MNIRRTLPLFGITLLVTTLGLSANSSESKDMDPPSRDIRMLNHLLEMPAEDLTELRLTIERIEAMSAEEKEAMRDKVCRFGKMEEAKRQAMRERYEAIPKETREAMRQRWKSLSPEERKAWWEKAKTLSPEERAQMMEADGILPGRPKHHKDPKEDRPEGPPPPREAE